MQQKRAFAGADECQHITVCVIRQLHPLEPTNTLFLLELRAVSNSVVRVLGGLEKIFNYTPSMTFEHTALVLALTIGFVACAPQAASNPKVCPPEAATPLLSTSTAPDTDPDAFCFSDIVDAEPDPSKAVTSNAITVRGINRLAPLKASRGTSVYVNDQFLEYFNDDTPAKTVKAGDKVKLLVSASDGRGETTVTTLTIGTVSSTFSVTTRR